MGFQAHLCSLAFSERVLSREEVRFGQLVVLFDGAHLGIWLGRKLPPCKALGIFTGDPLPRQSLSSFFFEPYLSLFLLLMPVILPDIPNKILTVSPICHGTVSYTVLTP